MIFSEQSMIATGIIDQIIFLCKFKGRLHGIAPTFLLRGVFVRLFNRFVSRYNILIFVNLEI